MIWSHIWSWRPAIKHQSKRRPRVDITAWWAAQIIHDPAAQRSKRGRPASPQASCGPTQARVTSIHPGPHCSPQPFYRAPSTPSSTAKKSFHCSQEWDIPTHKWPDHAISQMCVWNVYQSIVLRAFTRKNCANREAFCRSGVTGNGWSILHHIVDYMTCSDVLLNENNVQSTLFAV